ncbi:MAG: efflux RND transporter periplasmic adaptor subunit [Vicinamibacteraceae bacterium]
MSTGKKVIIGVVAVVVLGGAAAGNTWLKRTPGKPVSLEKVLARDLEAVVSASGKIQARTTVNIAADTMGRVVELAVDEGQKVTKGQFLMQIDPRNQRTATNRTAAGLAAARSQLEQLRSSVAASRENLALSRENLRRARELWAQQLTTRQALDGAESEVKVRETQLRDAEQGLSTQDQRIQENAATVSSAEYELSRTRIESPIDGLIVRRNIEQGETVVIGTMNNAGTVLLQIADMSIIEAEVEVDETDIPFVQIGQTAKVKIDAIPDKTFTGKVTEVGNSPIVQAAAGQSGQTATNFKVTVTIDGQIPEVRPGFTCTADVTTATRAKSVAVPIQAMAVRELIYDAAGKIVPQPKVDPKAKNTPRPNATDPLPAGQTRKDTEGVFLIKDAKATFIPVKTGIAGDKYFEVLSGLKAGDEVITGPFNSVRDLKDGDVVKPEEPKDRT